ncbi:intra-Golgi vesicle-mediated transport protein [Aureococcus anophagefferens]|uniref:Conserved oligomeric Golgi complex subunit 6 n=1 Tax=Aureococcus anophagefferens TaxID=44056 RepID=A0ABR1GC76_AURAN
MLEPDVDDGPTGPAADLLRRKVKETLELDLDAPELHDALEVVSEFWQGNTAENRRNLRSDLERRTVEQAEAFVAHYRPLRDALAGSEAMAAELEAHVAATARELRDREAENRRVVAAHDALVAERDALAAKREATVAFLARFQLGERERDALAAGDFEDADDADDFFAALARAAGALADLDRALADGSRCFADAVGCGETVRPSDGVGAELRDLLREATDGAHERLLAFALRALGGDATTAADAAAAAAACEAAAGVLAWTRQALASEGEVLRGLFFSDAAGGDGEAALLAAVVEGLGEPLARAPVAMRPVASAGARARAAASRLLAFYAATFRGRLGGDALPAAVAAVADEARTAAEAGAKALGGESVGRGAGRAAPLREFAGPATGAAADAVGAEPRGGAPGSAVDAAAWAVDAFGFCAAELAARRRRRVDAYAARFARRAAAAGAALAREAASALLRRCGLGPALGARAARLPAPAPRASFGAPRARRWASARTRGGALRSFYSSLFANPAPDVDAVHDEQRRAAARAAVAAILADAHAAVHALVDDDALGGYPAKADFLVHSPQQVRVLLDVEG